MTSYDIGDRRKLTVTITNESSTPTDPTSLTFKMREPDGTLTTWTYGTDEEIVRDSAGVYRVYWDVTQSGGHHYRWTATGNVGAAEESHFWVRRTLLVDDPA